MYKKLAVILTVALVVIAAFFLLAQKEKTDFDKSESKTKVVVTIFPLYDLVKQISGDKAEIVLLVPPGASPHTFEASPQLVKSISEAKVFLSVGAGLDGWTDNLIKSAEGQNVNKIDLSQTIALMPFAEHEGHKHSTDTLDDEHEHGDFDPHYWLDPQNGALLAMKIRDTLSDVDPVNRDFYNTNADKFIQELSSKEAEWRAKLDSLPNKKIAVFHDAWGYFANRFGLQVVAVFEIFPGKTPSPQYVIEFTKKVQEEKIQAIFVEPQLSQDAVRALANDLGVKVGILDPLGGFSDRLGYVEMLEYNVHQVYEMLM